MSLVMMDDRMKALRMLRNDTAPLSRRDALLFSLARQTTWTDRQRGLIDRMWREWQQAHAVAQS